MQRNINMYATRELLFDMPVNHKIRRSSAAKGKKNHQSIQDLSL